MIKLLDKIFNNFKDCFSRQASLHWFVVIIIGLMIHTDTLGLTSIIRDLGLYQLLRFVLVRYSDKACILVSTGLNQDSEAIIHPFGCLVTILKMVM